MSPFFPALLQASYAFFVFRVQCKTPFRLYGDKKILSPTFLFPKCIFGEHSVKVEDNIFLGIIPERLGGDAWDIRLISGGREDEQGGNAEVQDAWGLFRKQGRRLYLLEGQ